MSTRGVNTWNVSNHKNMEYPKYHTERADETVPKVIKVVNLKRFVPESLLECTPEIKISRKRVDLNWESSKIDNESKHNIAKPEKSVGVKNLENESKTPKSDDRQTSLDYYQTQMIGNGSKIKFRKCSHSHDELSTLHECTDETLVGVGDIFDTRESFKQYLNDNAKRWHYYYVCRNSKKKVIEYSCICMAYNVKQKEVVIRKQKKRTTACPCKLRLTVTQENKLIVYYVCNHHDHPTNASAFHHYPHAKYLPQHVKEEFLDLTYLGLDVDLIQKYIHSIVGLTIKKKDIWSYAYRFKRKIFKRSISNERQKYIEGLIAKIQETYGEPLDTKQHELPTEHSEVVISIKEVQLQQGKSHTIQQGDNPILDTLSNNLTLNYGEDLLKEVLGETTEDTELIVQYITEDGILCDENGVPITNSSAIMQFISNYAYMPVEELQETELSEMIHEEANAFDWSRPENTVVFENEPCVEEMEGAVLNEAAELLHGRINTERPKDKETVQTYCFENRLSPTPNTPAVYAEMDNFRKYYYIDHQYIPCEDQKTKQKSVLEKRGVYTVCHSGTDASGRACEEFIKAPDFVCHPTPIRHCSGHDHLTLLTDPDAILPGAKFLTHDVFLTYINERANRWFFYYSLVESGKIPEHYVYKCVYGKTRVSKNAYRSKGIRKRNSLTTQCPCQIRLRRIEADPTYLTVLYSCNHHDHELDSRQFKEQPHSRRLPLAIKEEVKDLITLGVGADVLRKYVFAETGVRVYGKYFHNVRAGMRARSEQRQYSEERLAALTKKIRDLEAIYGSGAKESNYASLVHNQPVQQKLPLPRQTKGGFSLLDQDQGGTPEQEYCELSDRDDFAEEVYIIQADTLQRGDTASQSRLETRLQNLSQKEILSRVKQLQDSVKSDGVHGHMDVTGLVNIG